MKIKITFKDGFRLTYHHECLSLEDTGDGLAIHFLDNAHDAHFNFKDYPIEKVEIFLDWATFNHG